MHEAPNRLPRTRRTSQSRRSRSGAAPRTCGTADFRPGSRLSLGQSVPNRGPAGTVRIVARTAHRSRPPRRPFIHLHHRKSEVPQALEPVLQVWRVVVSDGDQPVVRSCMREYVLDSDGECTCWPAVSAGIDVACTQAGAQTADIRIGAVVHHQYGVWRSRLLLDRIQRDGETRSGGT